MRILRKRQGEEDTVSKSEAKARAEEKGTKGWDGEQDRIERRRDVSKAQARPPRRVLARFGKRFIYITPALAHTDSDIDPIALVPRISTGAVWYSARLSPLSFSIQHLLDIFGAKVIDSIQYAWYSGDPALDECADANRKPLKLKKIEKSLGDSRPPPELSTSTFAALAAAPLGGVLKRVGFGNGAMSKTIINYLNGRDQKATRREKEEFGRGFRLKL
ncbi:hypothetical protein EVAR_46223_1 [Eumeta japonica]|uniref:Uncharacterized protein n=1 Tax=Eumeta variegata TaxID=151549 RepID=A0A4C1XQK8_EUMVA|nr:hypothetical protein EVAR_46223_1 [Eumeta japonica]